jgi:hypothetical protein
VQVREDSTASLLNTRGDTCQPACLLGGIEQASEKPSSLPSPLSVARDPILQSPGSVLEGSVCGRVEDQGSWKGAMLITELCIPTGCSKSGGHSGNETEALTS